MLLHDAAKLRCARTAPHERGQPARHPMRTPFAHAASCMPMRTLEREHSMCRVVLDRWPRESMKTNLSRVCRYRYVGKYKYLIQ